MNALKRKLSTMGRKDALNWYLKLYPNSPVRRKSAIYRDIMKRARTKLKEEFRCLK
jgi:hypothetical protein